MNNLAKVIALGGRRLNKALAMHYLFSAKEPQLPEGYIPLEYIESTGAQFNRTGFVPNQNTRVVCDFQFTAVPTGHWGVFGGRNGSAIQSKQYCFGYSNGFRTDYNSTRTSFTGNFDVTARHTVDKNKNVTTLDGVPVSQGYADFNTGNELVLFGINTTGAVANLSRMRLYSCHIYDNDVLVRDYKPCITPDGDIGMYDLIGREFHGNAGTGKFIYKTGYTPLDSLEFTGTQYVKLDLPITKDTVVRIKFNMTEVMGNAIVGVDGRTRLFNANGNAYLDWGRGFGGNRISGGTVAVGTTYDIEFGDFYVKDLSTGETIISGTPWGNSATLSKDPIQIMHVNTVPQTYGKGKVWLVEVIEKGERVRFLLPHTSNTGETGLHDVITDTFYGVIDTATASVMMLDDEEVTEDDSI